MRPTDYGPECAGPGCTYPVDREGEVCEDCAAKIAREEFYRNYQAARADAAARSTRAAAQAAARREELAGRMSAFRERTDGGGGPELAFADTIPAERLR